MPTIDITDETGQAADMTEPARKALSAAFANLTFPYEASLTFVSEADIQALNDEHRGVNAVTDVLSFPMHTREELSKPQTTPALLGDIVICYARAKAQAEEYGHSIAREAAFLAAHGALHLLGYDHETEEDEQEMFALQEQILSSIGLRRDA